jgi:hypothetical protein
MNDEESFIDESKCYDFIKEIEKLDRVLGVASFENMTINELKEVLHCADEVTKEWGYLSGDIDDMIKTVEKEIDLCFYGAIKEKD